MNNSEKGAYQLAARAAFPKTLPVLAGYLVLGFGFGLLLQSKGYHCGWAFLMSLAIYAGSLQYVGVDLLANGAGFVSTAIMSLLINARHLFYGLSMLVKYRDLGALKSYIIFGLTDETYSLVCTGDVPDGIDREKYYFCLTAFNHSYWVTGSTLGALFGQTMPINTAGVDFAMTALFVVVLLDNLKKQESRGPAVIGLAVSAGCLLIFGAKNFLIPSMIGIAAALLWLRKDLQGGGSDD